MRGRAWQIAPAGCDRFQAHLSSMKFMLRSGSGNRRRSPAKNDVVQLDGLQTQRLAEARGGDLGLNAAKTAIE